MLSSRLLPTTLCLCAAIPLAAQDVGSGPYSTTIKNEFVKAYFRNNFQVLVSFPPTGDVKRFGPTGLVQEFVPAGETATGNNATSGRYALVKADTSDTVKEGVNTVLQVYPALYSYYSSVTPANAGYPTIDTQSCPVLTTGSCQFQLFDKNYALFVYSAATVNGTSFTVKDPFFTRWRTLGGIGGIGPATGAEESVTSGAGSGAAATLQRFVGGYLYNITSGTQTGRLYVVKQPILDVYTTNNLHGGFLGLPTADEIVLANDRRRQTFEGGAIEYDVGKTPELRLPVNSVSVTVSSSATRLNLGDTVQLRADTFAGNGAKLDGRTVTWVSTNSRVLQVEPSGTTVNMKAVGGGSASITAVSEGKSSRALTFFVTAPCCQVGEGAPTAAIQQSFVDAVARNRLNVLVPAASPVRRIGAGFVQELAPADGSAARYYLAKPDSLAAAYLVTGAILTRYLELTGPTGVLGYPLSDATAGGRQLFEGGALGGNPAQLVTGPILTRWAATAYESGPAGLPRAAAQSVLSFQAVLGVAQTFAGGVFVGHLSGSANGRAFFVSGLSLTRYLASGGPGGSLGFPLSDEFAVSGRRRQDFEGGTIEYNPGDGEATARERDRTPQISATPSTVAAGGRIRVAAGGFPTSATLRINVGGQPDFVVPTETGAYAWEFFVPANAATGLVSLRAADVNGTAIAVGSYLVQSAAETFARVTKVSGDLQNGLPGARLPAALRIAVKDENGNAMSGLPVKFSPSPGAQIEEASTVTDERGEARAFLRLPLTELPALATAEAGRQVVTFSARSQAGSLTNFPRFSQAGQTGDTKLGNESTTIAQKGALLVASAAILRHLQNTGELTSPNGPADPLSLNQFLKDLCLFDAQGNRVCDAFVSASGGPEKNLNLWRLASFAGGAIDLAPVAPQAESIRDLLARGAPVLLALRVSSGDTVAGSHFVVAVGVAAGGAVQIHDPNPAFNRTSLDDYLNGFAIGSRQYKATLAAAIQFAPRAPSSLGFLVVTSRATAEIASSAGICGFGVSWPDVGATGQDPGTGASGIVQFRYCDGLQPLYQMDLAGAGAQTFVMTDLGTIAGRTELSPTVPAAFRLTRPGANWIAEVQQTAFRADGVLNAASFRPEVAPGALVSVFGSGLFLAGQATQAEIDGVAAPVVSGTPFQLNFRLPAEVAPGTRTLRIRSPFGTAEQPVEIKAVAPGLFAQPGGRGVVLNQNGSLNSPSNAATRGQVTVAYATGLGALRQQGNLQVAETAVRALIGGRSIETIYAGAAPGFPGVNQVNLRIPDDLPPGLSVELVLEQAGQRSNAVLIAIQ